MDTALLESSVEKKEGFSLWKALLFLLVVLLCMFTSSLAVCMSDNVCKRNIPTMSNMLNSSISAPFIVIGDTAAVAAHGLTATALYYRSKPVTKFWSSLQLFLAVILYSTLAVVLFVFPFTSWDHDWANIASLIALAAWMFISQLTLVRIQTSRTSEADRHVLRLSLVCIVLYILSAICYVVLRAVPAVRYAAGEFGRDSGILVSEIFIGMSVVIFMFLVVVHIRDVRIWFYTENKKRD